MQFPPLGLMQKKKTKQNHKSNLNPTFDANQNCDIQSITVIRYRVLFKAHIRFSCDYPSTNSI